MKTGAVVGMLLTAGLLAGCAPAHSPPIRMLHPDGRTTACGGSFMMGMSCLGAAHRDASCVSDFQRQGFERAVTQ